MERTGDPELDAMISETNELAKAHLETIVEIEEDQPAFKEEFTKDETEQHLVDDVLEDIEEFREEFVAKPVQTLPEFRDAIMQARFNGIQTISASKKVIYHFTKPNYPSNKYFLYEGIRVVEEGKEAEVEAYLKKDIHDQ